MLDLFLWLMYNKNTINKREECFRRKTPEALREYIYIANLLKEELVNIGNIRTEKTYMSF